MTAGQYLLYEIIPELKNQPLTKKTLVNYLTKLAKENPDKYAEISKKLIDLGTLFSYVASGSPKLEDLETPQKKYQLIKEYKSRIYNILQQEDDPKIRSLRISKELAELQEKMQNLIKEEAERRKNWFYEQIKAGARGNLANLSSLIGADIIVADHKDRPIPIAILNSYAEGVTPAEYWASTYGVRKGYVAVKFATGKSGFLQKQMALAAHKGVITTKDCGTSNGIEVDTDDPDNEGALLAKDYGPYKKDTILTLEILKALKDKGYDRILVRSPITCEAGEGLCSKCAGVRDKGKLPDIGDNVGINAVSALAEPLSQSQLAAKHAAGLLGQDKAVTGFDFINQILQVPKTFKQKSILATVEGKIEQIRKPEYGGYIVKIKGVEHYIPPDRKLKVKEGQEVDIGDPLSDGIINPAEMVKLRGIGDARLTLLKLLIEGYHDSDLPIHRRNAEVLARYAINHARITRNIPGFLMDDIVSFNRLQKEYKPRKDSKETFIGAHIIGKYLEQPVLHYTIGTPITKTVLNTLKKYGIRKVKVHDEPPDFEMEDVRLLENQALSDDWLERLGTFYVARGLQQAIEEGKTSRTKQESFIPAIITMKGFGEKLKEKGVY